MLSSHFHCFVVLYVTHLFLRLNVLREDMNIRNTFFDTTAKKLHQSNTLRLEYNMPIERFNRIRQKVELL